MDRGLGMAPRPFLLGPRHDDGVQMREDKNIYTHMSFFFRFMSTENRFNLSPSSLKEVPRIVFSPAHISISLSPSLSIMAAPASAAPSTLFDVVFGGQPLVEEIVAAHVYGAPTLIALKPGSPLTDEHLKQVEGKRVLVCGSYLKLDSLIQIGCRAKTLSVQPYSQAEADALKQKLTAFKEGMIDVSLFHIDTDKFPRTKRLIRRAFEPKSEHATTDEFFYRGLLHHAYSEPFTQEEAVRAWLRGEWLSEETLIETGVTTTQEHCRIADDIVKSACQVKRVGKTLRVVVNGSVLIIPVAKALAKQADAGVVIRYDLNRSVTLLTFVTENKTDLSWVHAAPWNGGGRDDCKGTTLSGLVPLPTLFDMLAA
jgi:hypothetical protein